jgi:multiple sugar transport system ATP-binding protein
MVKRVGGAAELLGLLGYLARKPADLSGGQRQRVAIGRAMVREPQAFLMDEPLSNLDAKLRVQMRAELARLHKQLATTIVYVTHDQVKAMTPGHAGGGGPRRRAPAGDTPRRCSTTRSTCSWPGSSARRP